MKQITIGFDEHSPDKCFVYIHIRNGQTMKLLCSFEKETAIEICHYLYDCLDVFTSLVTMESNVPMK